MKKLLYLAFISMPVTVMAQDGSTTTTTTQQTTTVPGASINMSINGMPAGTATQQSTTTTITTTTTTNGGGTPQTLPPPPLAPQNAPAPTGCDAQYPMAPSDYEDAKRSIAEKDFENTKLTMAKQVVSNNCMSAEEIRGVMKLFTYENSKLDFAKYAYTYCSDKNNYYKVNDAFEFDNSSQELSNYINGNH